MSGPITFDCPTLGDVIILGELYNADSNKFFGAQLFTQDTINKHKIVTTREVPYTDLSLCMSNTFQSKADVLDINANLSIKILAGTITVSGSAGYLNDTKSNSNQNSWAMRLKYLGKEERIEVSNPKLDVISSNASSTGSYSSATHYVSAIRYGGNVVVSMVEENQKLSDDEKIKGHLSAELNGLKGDVGLKLEGTIDVDVVKKYAYLDNKFDVEMYGDFTISKVPVNAKDVVEVFADAMKALQNGGVPVSVTLQPIPPDIRSISTTIYNLNESVITNLLNTYSTVADLKSRFVVLLGDTERDNDFIPWLNSAVDDANTSFLSDYVAVVQALKTYIGTVESGTAADVSSVMKTATDLINKHRLTADDSKPSPPTYPSSLAGLEQAFSKFSRLEAVVRSHTIESRKVSLISLSSLKALATTSSDFYLFLSWSLSVTATALFSKLVGMGLTVYSNDKKLYHLYVENTGDLDDDSLPKGSEIPTTSPDGFALLHYTKSDNTITWTPISWDDVEKMMPTLTAPPTDQTKTLYACDLNLSTIDINKSTAFAYCKLTLDNYKPDRSFTVIVRAWASEVGESKPSALACLGATPGSLPHYCLQIKKVAVGDVRADVMVYDQNNKTYLSVAQSNVLKVYAYSNFEVAFVQNIATSKWIIYANGGASSVERTFPDKFVWTDVKLAMDVVAASAPSSSALNCVNWQGGVNFFRGYPTALSAADILTIYQKKG